MRENRPYGSEGGEATSLPDPYPKLRACNDPGSREERAPGKSGAVPAQGRDKLRRDRARDRFNV